MRLMNKAIAIVMMVIMVFSTVGTGFALETTPQKSAVAYLKSVQNADGGFPSTPGQKSSPATTAWVVMGLKAAYEDLGSKAWTQNGNNPASYLQGAKVSFESLNDYSRFTLACSALGIKPELNGENMLQKLLNSQEKNGQFTLPDEAGDQMINAHIWAVLAIDSTKNAPKNRAAALKWLLSAQNKDGGYGWYVGASSDPDDTGAAIQALVVLGEKPAKSKAIKNALAYLKTTQSKTGGYGLMQTPNAASDAWVMQGLLATGQDTTKVKAHLLSLQEKDGSFKWREDAASQPVMMTAYSLAALSGHAHPVNRTKQVK